MEYIKRINKMWTNDTLFLREYLYVPCFLEASEVNDRNSVAADGPSVSCRSKTSSFPESLNAVSISENKGNSEFNGSRNSDYEKSVQEYLGSMDSQIKEAKSRAHTLQKTRYIHIQLIVYYHQLFTYYSYICSEVLKNDPDLDVYTSFPQSLSSSQLRINLSNLGGELNAATNLIDQCPSATVVSGSSKKMKASFHIGRSRDEIFEL